MKPKLQEKEQPLGYAGLCSRVGVAIHNFINTMANGRLLPLMVVGGKQIVNFGTRFVSSGATQPSRRLTAKVERQESRKS